MGFTLGISGSASKRFEMATFSATTLAKFADACASIPIRPLDRAFDRAGIRAGVTDDDSGGARRTRFRQYLSTIDQKNARQLQQLGDALGALIDEAATSKQPFLIAAAEGDGFEYVDGAFRVAATEATAFAIARLDDSDAIDDRLRRLHVLARNRPVQAIAGARQLAESVVQIVGNTYGIQGNGKSATTIRAGLEQLTQWVERLDELAKANSTDDEMTPAHAGLAVDSAGTFVRFVAGIRVRKQATPGRIPRR
jgi:hypothetical protein